MRLLIVEDDSKIASFIIKGFRQAGFAVDHAADGEEGLQLALAVTYDAAIVDIMLPELDGLGLIGELRHQGINTPVLILSAKRSLDDRIKGIQKGGDDYLVKPFSFSELLVRVQALIRRSSRTVEPSSLTYGDFSIDLLKREVIRSDKKIELQPREFALLEYLMRNPERVVSKTMILEHIWDFHFDPQTNVVDVLVCRLRNKVEKGFPQKMIHTIRGVGYVFKDPSKDI
ncbi:MAG: response regulator transcription factor [Deltaproteobacteria bacterium]|nr:response regulator transcription factor [Deltaproteobacteria bacterium]MBW2157818.1 response regulator transcription factor [Deltaproteobacteria bacterium]MBW2327700.1 response regulator transcription factor [Deltaproteobacteria bacterium]